MHDHAYWNGPEAAHRRIMYKGAGYSDVDIRTKPHIGIANTFSEASPATSHLRGLADAVKQGIWSAGGLPFEFGVPGLCGNIAVGHENCRYELAERDMVSAAIEVVCRINHFDGLVTLSSCDDILAGTLLGVGRIDIPTVMVTGGPMLPGRYQGKPVLAPDIEEVTFAGTAKDDLLALEDAACPGCGSCGVMGTANTMQILVEALGLALPGSSTIPAVMADRLRAARASGRRAVELVQAALRPSAILNRQAFGNAIAVDLAIGGSTNAVLHLLALAREVGIPLTLDDFEAFSRKLCCICAVRPNGPHHLVDFHQAGGVPLVLKMLEPFLDTSVVGVGLKPLRRLLHPIDALPNEVIHSLEDPVQSGAGLAVLKGNLAPEGAIVRPSGVPRKMKSFQGPARIFDNEPAAIEAMQKGRIQAGDVVVLRYLGPKGAPGMRYAQAACQALVGLGLHKTVGLLTDGRFSGFNHGPIVGHLSPEAFSGGPLALIQEEDLITVDIDRRSLNVDLSPATLAERRSKWKAPATNIERGWLALYAANCRSASEGAAMQPWRG